MPGDIGLTALLVAAARAQEASRPDSLAQDDFAQHFVRAGGVDWPVAWSSSLGRDPLWGRLGRYFGLRTRLLDDFAPGTPQTVLLGAGLDSRAFRLRWPSDSHVFELDRASVLDFKHRVLATLGAVPLVKRTPVEADLRHNWSAALLGTGFAPGLPTTWIAEGPLLDLPAAAELALIRTVNTFSEPGSRLFYEAGVDLLSQCAGHPRPDSAALLSSLGWDVSVHTCLDFTARYGVPAPADPLAGNRWVFATTGA